MALSAEGCGFADGAAAVSVAGPLCSGARAFKFGGLTLLSVPPSAVPLSLCPQPPFLGA